MKRFGATLPFPKLCETAACSYQFLTTTVAFSFLEHASLTFFKGNFELKAGRNKPCLCVILTACCQTTFSLKAVQWHSKHICKWPFLEIKHLAKKTVDTCLPRSKQESCFAKLLRVAGLVLFNQCSFSPGGALCRRKTNRLEKAQMLAGGNLQGSKLQCKQGGTAGLGVRRAGMNLMGAQVQPLPCGRVEAGKRGQEPLSKKEISPCPGFPNCNNFPWANQGGARQTHQIRKVNTRRGRGRRRRQLMQPLPKGSDGRGVWVSW